jgi:hypothetical protein
LTEPALSALDAAFFVVHSIWIGFICVGWAWKRTRRAHLAAVVVTALSWFGLGAWFGWGYCPMTDWHWQVRERLGHQDPRSYVQLLVRVVTGIELTPGTADAVALGTLGLAAVATAVANLDPCGRMEGMKGWRNR